MTTKEYIARLKSLSDTNKEITSRTTKLSKLAPSDTDSEEGNNRIDLGEEIHESLKELETEFEILTQECEDVVHTSAATHRRRDPQKENERIELITHIERFSEDLKVSRGQFRRAQLEAKRREEEHHRQHFRQQLFAAVEQEGDKPSGGRRRGKDENRTQEDVILSAAGDVTAGLRRTHQLMTQELERSRFAHDTLVKSTVALNSLNESYTGIDDLLKSSRSLLSTLVSSQKSDTWYLETALKIAVATLIWLIFRRWFYGPILYLVYRPSRFMLSIVYSILNVTLGVLTGTVFKLSDESSLQATPSRPPLIIKPSAGGPPPTREAGQAPPVVKVGLGGGEAHELNEEERRKDRESYQEWVAEMADQAKNQEKQYQAGYVPDGQDHGAAGGSDGGAGNTVHGGDGTVLKEREPDEPANPKKRMMEDIPAQDKGKTNKDEL